VQAAAHQHHQADAAQPANGAGKHGHAQDAPHDHQEDSMGIYVGYWGRNPRSVIADELDALGFPDPWDLAGHLLDELTDQDVADLAAIRGII
jgi:hypothetical protein